MKITVEGEKEKAALLALHKGGLSWRQIAKMERYRGILAGALWSFAHGERDLAECHKAQLGIPFDVPVAACLKCGIAHTYDCNPQKPKSIHKPTPPAWVTQAADFLAAQERENGGGLNVVYARGGGKVVKR